MELLFSIVVLGAVVVVLLAARARIRAASAGGARPGPLHGTGTEVTPDDAAAASDRLSADAHARVYSYIAQGNMLQAMTAYRQSTGAGRSAAMDAVVAMAAHPQPYRGNLD